MPDDTTAPTPGVRKVNKPEEPAAAKPAETGDRPSQTGADVDERFFNRRDHAEADLQPAQHDAADLEEIDPRIRRKQTPEARARRAKASRVVVGATVLCGILGLVALTRIHAKPYSTPGPVATLVIPAQPYVPVKATASAALPTGSAQEVAKADLGASPAASASGAVAEAPSGSAVAPAASSSAKLQEPIVALGQAAKAEGADPAAAAQPPIPGTGDPTEADKKEAAKEKRACQGMLEQGAFAKAIEAGERSVQLDPSDGDAWLYLGAAYQSIGKRAEARRSFLSCTTEAKKGQINECRLMLRQ
jgi:hypothetical protein